MAVRMMSAARANSRASMIQVLNDDNITIPRCKPLAAEDYVRWVNEDVRLAL